VAEVFPKSFHKKLHLMKGYDYVATGKSRYRHIYGLSAKSNIEQTAIEFVS